MTSDVIEIENQFCAHNYHPLEKVLVKGKGVYLFDEDGKRYIDMMSAYSAVSHGHCNKKLLRAMNRQAKKLCVTSRAFYTDKLGSYLERLCQLSGFDMALPMNTGAEAVETAIKAARKWAYEHESKRIPDNSAEIIVCEDNFHGRTSTIVSFSTDSLAQNHFGPKTPGFVTIPYNDAEALEKAITKKTAAFLVEPIQGEAGVVAPSAGYLKKCAEICKRHNILLMVDEIQTGMGRTGKMFAFQHEDIQPDCVLVGKALGGGIYPVSAFLSSKEVMSVFTPGTHGSTFGGNPLASAIAEEALNILVNDGLIDNSRDLGQYFFDRLNNIQHRAIKEVRGKGLFLAVELHSNVITGRLFCEKLAANGVLSKETHATTIRFAPPLVITKRELDKAIAIIEKTLTEI